jgi:hypothetical protein
VVVGMGVGFHGCLSGFLAPAGALSSFANLAVLYPASIGDTSGCHDHWPAGLCCLLCV